MVTFALPPPLGAEDLPDQLLLGSADEQIRLFSQGHLDGDVVQVLKVGLLGSMQNLDAC